MNCKQGDLAVIVSPLKETQHIGKIVRCIETGIPVIVNGVGPFWITEPELIGARGNPIYWRDAALRPIRDPGEDAQDETLSWLPVPHEEAA